MNCTDRRQILALAVALMWLPACSQEASTNGQQGAASDTQSAATSSSSANPNAAADGGTTVFARIGDQTITEAQVREVARPQLVGLRKSEYDILKSTLDNMFHERLLDIEAERRGIDVQALMVAEVGDKAPEATPDEVDAFYEANKDRINQPLDQIAEAIASKITRDHQAERMGVFLSEIQTSLNAKVTLEPYRIEVGYDDGDPSIGPKDAPVTVVEFSDFECGYCAQASQVVHELKEKYGDKVRVVFRDFPLDFHASAQKAAEAAQCAHDQGKFWDMHDRLFGGQRDLSIPALKQHATALGLDPQKFAECLDGDRHADEVKADMAAGAEAGVSGTPAFFVNGRMLSGAQPVEEFAKLIDEELKLRVQ